MDTSLSKNERFEIRLSAEERALFAKAQKLSGDRSISSFILRVVKNQAQEIVRQSELLTLTQRDRNRFFELALSESAPNSKLKSAAARYQNLVK
ncbi:MAG: DUF1778 domain-containing protein [Sphingobacteriaceae bacterium]|nr:DUF1778 domain-containing protein [Sphingobacteriaceae bacterium]